MKKKNKVGLKIFIWIVIVALFWSIIGPVVYSLFPVNKVPVITNNNNNNKPEVINKDIKDSKGNQDSENIKIDLNTEAK